jgi:hypothetical protein
MIHDVVTHWLVVAIVSSKRRAMDMLSEKLPVAFSSCAMESQEGERLRHGGTRPVLDCEELTFSTDSQALCTCCLLDVSGLSKAVSLPLFGWTRK